MKIDYKKIKKQKNNTKLKNKKNNGIISVCFERFCFCNSLYFFIKYLICMNIIIIQKI